MLEKDGADLPGVGMHRRQCEKAIEPGFELDDFVFEPDEFFSDFSALVPGGDLGHEVLDLRAALGEFGVDEQASMGGRVPGLPDDRGPLFAALDPCGEPLSRQAVDVAQNEGAGAAVPA